MHRDFTPEELVYRRPVWTALSDLFLDTDTSLFVDSVARALAPSPYTMAELEGILLDEVYPALRDNWLWWVWDSFDPEWLEARIRRRQRSWLRRPALHFVTWRTWGLRELWAGIGPRIERYRHEGVGLSA
jgi:hypothetical protein